MRELPTGTVTFLFTDIEGSTRLLQKLGDRYPAALAEHRREVRRAFVAHGGFEVDTQGDAFFVAFARPRDAVAAASEAQEALEGGPIRVRMGIHTGTPLPTEEGYAGMDVHRGARICAAAHGGQIVVSERTRTLVESEFDLRDLGRHRLKDLGEPEKLFQLGEGEFPLLRSLNATNLPPQPTPLVGRERELGELLAALREHPRLVTVTGPGGVGKTRLALQAAAELADEFDDGVYWVSLAALTDTDLVLPTVARTVGSQNGLAEHIDECRMLLLLDNLEQILGCAPQLAKLLASCPNLKLLVTSRAVLHLFGEQEYQVPPLPEPDAVALFAQRAQLVEPGFQPNDEVAEICRRLDGLPLALELAAARVKVLAPGQILERLGGSLDLLTGGAVDVPERQRTLRATIEWSYELLSEEEKRLFERLAVFAGSLELRAAEAICEADLDGVQSLVDKSLLRHAKEGRFFMLETIRDYALEKLAASGGEEEIRSRHAQWFLALAEAADARHEQEDEASWVESLAADVDNFRTALDLLRITSPTDHLRLAAALTWFWMARLHLKEGRERLEEALRPSGERDRTRAKALTGVANIAASQGEIKAARAYLDEAYAIADELGDSEQAANALGVLAFAELTGDDLPAARRATERWVELAEQAGIPEEINRARTWLLQMLVADHEVDLAEPLALESLKLAVDQGDPIAQGLAHHFLGDCGLIRGDCDAAEQSYRQSLELAWRRGASDWTLGELQGMAMAAAGLGRPERALRLGAAAENALESFGIDQSGIKFWSALLDRYYGLAREALGTEASAASWEQGRQLSLDEAIREALDLA